MYEYPFIILLALRMVVDSKILDSLLLFLLAFKVLLSIVNFGDPIKKDLYATMALIIARWCVASEVFSWVLVLYSIYYSNGSPKKLAIVLALVWYLDLLYPY